MTMRMKDFWSGLREALHRAEAMPHEQASVMMAQYLDDNRGLWPYIKEDAEGNGELRALLERGLGREVSSAPM